MVARSLDPRRYSLKRLPGIDSQRSGTQESPVTRLIKTTALPRQPINEAEPTLSSPNYRAHLLSSLRCPGSFFVNRSDK